MLYESLIRCCAPTMACLKTGNMFVCGFECQEQMTCELRELNLRLGEKGLRILPLRWTDGKVLLYMYRPKLLERDLQNVLSQKILAECGYTSTKKRKPLSGICTDGAPSHSQRLSARNRSVPRLSACGRGRIHAPEG